MAGTRGLRQEDDTSVSCVSVPCIRELTDELVSAFARIATELTRLSCTDTEHAGHTAGRFAEGQGFGDR